MQGKLIVIDGADGAGKATQTKLIVERLLSEGKEVKQLDFPQYKSNFFGKLLRQCLDGEHGDFVGVHPKIASTLYANDRLESSPMIREWLLAGNIVILDRYVSSNMLHQGSKIKDEDELTEFLTWLDHMEHTILNVPRPDLIVYLDVPFAVRKTLMNTDTSRKSIDVHEEDEDFQRASEECARKIVAKTNNWQMINCTKNANLRTREDIHADVYGYVTKVL